MPCRHCIQQTAQSKRFSDNARRGRLGEAGRGEARHGAARQARHGRLGGAWQDSARRGKAGKARQGKARLGTAGKAANKPTLSRREVNATPLEFRDELLRLAMMAHNANQATTPPP